MLPVHSAGRVVPSLACGGKVLSLVPTTCGSGSGSLLPTVVLFDCGVISSTCDKRIVQEGIWLLKMHLGNIYIPSRQPIRLYKNHSLALVITNCNYSYDKGSMKQGGC